MKYVESECDKGPFKKILTINIIFSKGICAEHKNGNETVYKNSKYVFCVLIKIQKEMII